jgi:rod shape determining protein RodA
VERPWYQSFNWVMAIAAIAIACAGVVVIQSADLHSSDSASEWHKQLVYIGIGICVMATLSAIDYHKWEKWARGLYIANFLLLAIVRFGGHSALGAQRWISLGPIVFQPSEPAKLILAIAAAALLAKPALVGWREMGVALVAIGAPSLLILIQPDLGTTLVVFAILSAQLFFAVAKTYQFIAYAAVVAVAGWLVVGTKYFLKPFQRNRLLVFLHPNADPQGAGWNLNQSKIAVGSGELFGKGLYHGTQTQLNFVPEHSRDFIFTVVGEEGGYVSSIALIFMYGIVLFGAVRAMLAARDRFGVLLAVGLVAMLAFHITINIGMTVGIMPITGIPLPFMSYGGTAILTDFAAIGLLLNIYVQRDRLVFE